MPGNLGAITDIALTGEFAYLVNGGEEQELVILNISDIDNPRLISRTNIGGQWSWNTSISVTGDYAYISVETHLFCYDVSNPENPVDLGFWASDERIRDITATEDFVYVAAGMSGIFTLDISDPEDIQTAGYYNTTGSAWEVHVMDNLLVVADNTNIGIYENSLLSAPDFSDQGEIPTEFVLYPAFPNPFNSSTIIRYELPQSSFVSLHVYNPTGQIIAVLQEGNARKGAYSISWNAGNLPSGLYYISLNSSDQSFSQKLILTR